VKTQNAFNPTVEKRPWEPSEGLPELFEGGSRFKADVLDRWVRACPSLVDLRGAAQSPVAEQVRRGIAAMSARAPVVLGGWLPPDQDGHRVGRPDALVRGADRADGGAVYHPVEVKFHLIADRHRPRPDESNPRIMTYSTLGAPSPEHRRHLPGYGLRLGRREADFLQLAHYHRMLQAAGFAGTVALGAVIGTDAPYAEPGPTGPVLAWADLSEPAVRTFSRSQPEGWRLRSMLERYDHEHAFRVDIATVAQAQSTDPAPASEVSGNPPLLVSPIRVPECARCQWWEHCRPKLDPGDLSLRIDTSPLDPREIAALRRQGVGTITDLAGTDLDALLPSYLPEVTHRAGAEGRLRTAARRARMLLDSVDFARETAGEIEVPGAEIEVDFDIETSAAGRIYLWGFAVQQYGDPGSRRYHEFSRFVDLDADAEVDLAIEALGWLRRLVEGSRTVAVYHYSGYEVAMITELARRAPRSELAWAAAYAAEDFVDLLEVVKQHFFGVAGLGLKRIAAEAGFRWRDDDPGGLNSQRWFLEAVHGERADQREAARQRVLEYNEDDVIATSEVRRWLRAQ
jgi:predicted RecB family nuclease